MFTLKLMPFEEKKRLLSYRVNTYKSIKYLKIIFSYFQDKKFENLMKKSQDTHELSINLIKTHYIPTNTFSD